MQKVPDDPKAVANAVWKDNRFGRARQVRFALFGILFLGFAELQWLVPGPDASPAFGRAAVVISAICLFLDWRRNPELRGLAIFRPRIAADLAPGPAQRTVGILIVGMIVAGCLYFIIDAARKENALSELREHGTLVEGKIETLEAADTHEVELTHVDSAGNRRRFPIDGDDVVNRHLVVGAPLSLVYPPGEPERAVPRDFAPGTSGVGRAWMILLALAQFPLWYWIKGQLRPPRVRN